MIFGTNPTIENFQNLILSLDDLEVDTSELKKLVFNRRHTFLKIPHANFHTDFLPVMEGLESFRTCRKKAEHIDIDGVTFPVISYEDLIANKRAVNRKADQSDIEELARIKKRKGRGTRRK